MSIGNDSLKRSLVNLKGGSLAADSSEAVTGAQLYTAKKNAADALGGGAGVGKDGSFTGPSYTVQGATKNNVGDALGTLDTAVSQQGSSLTNISNTVNQLNSGTAGLVTQDAESKAISVAKGRGGDSVDFTGEDGDTKEAIKRTLKGIAGGSLAADSSEAVTGAQLYTAKKNAADALGGGAGVGKDGSFTGPSYTVQGATKNNVGDALGTLDTAVSQQGSSLTNISNTVNQLNSGTAGLVTQDAESKAISVAKGRGGDSVDFTGEDGDTKEAIKRTLKGIAGGSLAADSSEAVTGAQLYTAKKNAADALGGGAGVGKDGSFTGPSYTVQGATKNNVGDALGTLDTAVSQQGSSLTNISNTVNQLNSGTAGLVTQDAESKAISVAKGRGGDSVDFTGEDGDTKKAIKRTLKGIAGGSLAADSSEAVTGAQLYTAKKNAADALGGGAGVGKDGSFTGPSYTVQGATKNNVGDALGTLDTAVSQQGSSLTNISNTVNQLNSGTAGLVTQDAESKAISVAKGRGGDSVDFTGEDGDTKEAIKRTLKGIAGGSLAADSSEAVTGAQLYTAKKNAADALGGGAGVGKDGSFTGPSYTVQGATKNNVGDALGTLDTAVSQQGSSLTNISNTVNQLNSGTAGLVTQDAESKAISVAKGRGGDSVDFTGEDGDTKKAIKRTLKGIAGGSLAADSSEAVTGAQLYTAKKNAADALGGGAGVGKDGSFTGPSYTVQGATKNNVGDALGTLDTAVSQQGSSLTNISNTVNQLNSGTAGLVTQDAESKAISVAKGRGGDSVDFTGEDGDTKEAIKRTLKGIAGGSLAADSSEAVTGAQLYTAKKNAADALGGGAGVGKDGSFTGPSYTVQGATKNNVGDALGTLDTVITKHGSSIKSIKNSMEFMQNDINDLKSGGSGLIKQDKVTGDISVGKNTSGNRVDFSNLSESGEKKSRKLSGVSEGEISSTSTDAVNGKQLYETNKQVKDNADRINGIAAGINDVVSGKSGIVKQKNANGTITIGSETDGNAVSIAGKSGDRVIKGVKDGINENDAATVGQLNKISGSAKMIAINNKKNSNVPTASGENAIAIGPSSVSSGNKSISMGENAVASGNNSVALGQGSKASAANSVALGSGSLADQDNTFSVGNSMQQRRITNVAPGVKTNDAVTVGQLNSVRSEVNKNFMKLKNDLNNIDRKLTAGIASSMAMSGIPQAYQPDSSFMGGSIASYNGAGAVAIGASKVSQSGRYVTKFQGSLNSQNDVGMSIGFGIQW